MCCWDSYCRPRCSAISGIGWVSNGPAQAKLRGLPLLQEWPGGAGGGVAGFVVAELGIRCGSAERRPVRAARPLRQLIEPLSESRGGVTRFEDAVHEQLALRQL